MSRNLKQKLVSEQKKKQDIEEKEFQKKKENIIFMDKNTNKDYLVDLYFQGDEYLPSDDILKQDIEKFAPKLKVRTAGELIKESEENFKEALSNVQFATCLTDKFVISDNEEGLERIKGLIQIEPITLKRLVFDFGFIYGNYNLTKKWIRIPDTIIFISFPDLLKQGKHATFVLLNLTNISEKLKLLDNAFISVLLKAKIPIKPEQRIVAFSKGHLINEEKRKEILNDINLVFNEMKKPLDKRDYSKLLFFGK